jgi:hypothetical protein
VVRSTKSKKIPWSLPGRVMLGQVMLGQVPPERPLDGSSTRDSIYFLTHDACQAFAASIRQLAFLKRRLRAIEFYCRCNARRCMQKTHTKYV